MEAAGMIFLASFKGISFLLAGNSYDVGINIYGQF